MKARAVLTMTVFGLLATAVVGQLQQELDALQGKWKQVTGEIDGKTVPLEKIQYTRFFIEKDKLISGAGDKRSERKFKLDVAKDPKTIDLIEIVKEVNPATMKTVEKTVIRPGIYRFRNNVLTICINEAGKERPTEFRTTPRSGLVVVVLEKDK